MSTMGKLMNAVIRRHFNANPEKCADPVAAVQRLDKQNKFRTNGGYVIEKLTTVKGTKYERAYPRESRFSGKAVLYLHGGAYIAGLTEPYRKMAKPFSQAAGGAEIFYLDYRVAPQYTYPTQLDEAMDMWQELTERLGYEPQRIVIGGDSAGGNLTLALLLRLRDEGKPLPAAAFCWSPWADMTASGESYTAHYHVDVMFGNRRTNLTEEQRRDFLSSGIFAFVGDADRTDPYVSPVYGDYHDFPPMFFAVGGDEMLLSDTTTIAEKLQEADVPVEVESQPHMFHVYPMFYSLIPEAKISFRRTLAFIAEHLRKE